MDHSDFLIITYYSQSVFCKKKMVNKTFFYTKIFFYDFFYKIHEHK